MRGETGESNDISVRKFPVFFAFFLDMKGVTKGRWCGMELWLEVSAGGLELLFYAKMHNYEG